MLVKSGVLVKESWQAFLESLYRAFILSHAFLELQNYSCYSSSVSESGDICELRGGMCDDQSAYAHDRK